MRSPLKYSVLGSLSHALVVLLLCAAVIAVAVVPSAYGASTSHEEASLSGSHEPGSTVRGTTRDRAIRSAATTPQVWAVLRVHPGDETVQARWTATGTILVYWKSTSDTLVATAEIDPTTFATKQVAGTTTTLAPGRNAFAGSWLNSWWLWAMLCVGLMVALVPSRWPGRLIAADIAALMALQLSAWGYFVLVPHRWAYPYTALCTYLLACGALVWIAVQCVRFLLRRRPTIGIPDSRFSTTTIAVACSVIVIVRLLAALLHPVQGEAGLASVYGAQFLNEYGAVYGRLQDNQFVTNGDTYGPLTYIAYSPVVAAVQEYRPREVFHAVPQLVAVGGDILVMTILAIAAVRFGDRRRAVRAVMIWACLAPTTIVMVNQSNDWIVASLMAAAILALASPVRRGLLIAAAGWAQFAVFPALLSVVRIGNERWRPHAVRFLIATISLSIAMFLIAVQQPQGVRRFWTATVTDSMHRDTTNSIAGMLGAPDWLFTVLTAGAIICMVGVLWRLRVPSGAAALAGMTASLIALQLPFRSWWFSNIVWMLPTLIVLLIRSRDDLDHAGVSDVPSSASSTGT